MNRLTSIFIILIFISVAVLGFSIVSHDSYVMCPAEQMQGKRCPATDPFGVLAFHLQAFELFVAGIFVFYALTVLLILFVILISIDGNLVFAKFGQQLKKLSLLVNLFYKKFLHWFSLLENSPSYL